MSGCPARSATVRGVGGDARRIAGWLRRSSAAGSRPTCPSRPPAGSSPSTTDEPRPRRPHPSRTDRPVIANGAPRARRSGRHRIAGADHGTDQHFRPARVPDGPVRIIRGWWIWRCAADAQRGPAARLLPDLGGGLDDQDLKPSLLQHGRRPALPARPRPRPHRYLQCRSVRGAARASRPRRWRSPAATAGRRPGRLVEGPGLPAAGGLGRRFAAGRDRPAVAAGGRFDAGLSAAAGACSAATIASAAWVGIVPAGLMAMDAVLSAMADLPTRIDVCR